MRKFLLLAVMAAFFVGCGAKGPQFTTFKQAESGKSLLYVYRGSGFIGGGAYYNVHLKTSNSDIVMGELRNGGYLETTLEPNQEVEIWAKTEAKASLLLTPAPNETYCVRGGVGIGFFVGRPKLELVSLATCKEEISKTNLSINSAPKK